MVAVLRGERVRGRGENRAHVFLNEMGFLSMYREMIPVTYVRKVEDVAFALLCPLLHTNPQRMPEGYSSQLCLSVYLLH